MKYRIPFLFFNLYVLFINNQNQKFSKTLISEIFFYGIKTTLVSFRDGLNGNQQVEMKARVPAICQ